MSRQNRLNHSMLCYIICALLIISYGSVSIATSSDHTVFDMYGTINAHFAWQQHDIPSLRHDARIGMTAFVDSWLVARLLFQHRQIWGEQYSPYFKTEEATLTFRSPSESQWSLGQWHVGRLRFQLGPVGMLAANPFDALEGIHWLYTGSAGTSEIVYARIDTSYVTYLNYVYDHDDLIALRYNWEFPRLTVGVTGLLSGLGTERGISTDVFGTIDDTRNWVIELAAYEQSKTSMTYDGWHVGVIGSADLYVDHRTAVTLNAGYVDDGFVPMVSNLQYAGGSLGFSNGTLGAELYVSHSLQPDTVIELDLGGRTRWQQPNSNARLSLTTAAYPPNIVTVSVEGRHDTDMWYWLAELSATVQF